MAFYKEKSKMKNILLVLTVMISSAVYGQDQPSAEQQQPTAGQVLSMHYYRTYQAGIRYNDFGVAKQALYNIIVENPQNDSILYSLSLLYYQSQNYASAALTAQDVLTLNPDNISALEIAAISMNNLGAKERALETYETLYLKTDNYQTLYQMAFLQYELKKFAESKTNADILMNKTEAAELKASYNDANGNPIEYPIKVALWNLKGLIAQEEGDKSSAEKFYNEALAISPDFQLAKDNLAALKK